MIVELILPWPPSVNHYWRSPSTGKLAGRHLVSEKGRQYRESVACHVSMEGAARRLPGRLEVIITLHPPDRRRRDIDNSMKSLLDALGHAGVYEDDSQIDRLHIVRQWGGKPGTVVVRIEEIRVLG